MSVKYHKAHQHLIAAKVLMAELGYDEAGNIIDQAAAANARLLTRVIAEHKYAFKLQIAYPHRHHIKTPG